MSVRYSNPKLDAVFSALASGKRRGMVNSLAYSPSSVSQLAQEFNLTLPAMFKHVRALEKARLIQRKKVGRTNFVALRRDSLREVQAWAAQFHADWGNDQETLENYIASMNK